ncbi:Hypothetical predicted protein [Cloeon dipterum]|uniref:Uncharacterized protein n=1 Tax=Cloeon dipterum TaxID=197152 RepID=A0A8S1D0A2_9INSE|nr:Hypothetical predicted protein [Cloeon dipterum]
MGIIKVTVLCVLLASGLVHGQDYPEDSPADVASPDEASEGEDPAAGGGVASSPGGNAPGAPEIGGVVGSAPAKPPAKGGNSNPAVPQGPISNNNNLPLANKQNNKPGKNQGVGGGKNKNKQLGKNSKNQQPPANNKNKAHQKVSPAQKASKNNAGKHGGNIPSNGVKNKKTAAQKKLKKQVNKKNKNKNAHPAQPGAKNPEKPVDTSKSKNPGTAGAGSPGGAASAGGAGSSGGDASAGPPGASDPAGAGEPPAASDPVSDVNVEVASAQDPPAAGGDYQPY